MRITPSLASSTRGTARPCAQLAFKMDSSFWNRSAMNIFATTVCILVPVEVIFKELKSGLGLGEHQVTGEKNRVEKSVCIAVTAYLFLLIARKNDIRPGKPWSFFQLQNNLRMEVMTHQFNHLLNLRLNKSLNS